MEEDPQNLLGVERKGMNRIRDDWLVFGLEVMVAFIKMGKKL